jgi:hypothetical protein
VGLACIVALSASVLMVPVPQSVSQPQITHTMVVQNRAIHDSPRGVMPPHMAPEPTATDGGKRGVRSESPSHPQAPLVPGPELPAMSQTQSSQIDAAKPLPVQKPLQAALPATGPSRAPAPVKPNPQIMPIAPARPVQAIQSVSVQAPAGEATADLSPKVQPPIITQKVDRVVVSAQAHQTVSIDIDSIGRGNSVVIQLPRAKRN